jgi:uncharacterized protein YxeA
MKKLLVGFVSLILVAGVAAGAAYAFHGDHPAKEPERKYKSKKVRKPKTVKTASGLEYTITAKGNGPQGAKGSRITVLYTANSPTIRCLTHPRATAIRLLPLKPARAA